MTFKPGSKVLAYHGPLVYEAKVLQSYEAGKTFTEDVDGHHVPLTDALSEELRVDHAYFLHYKGWKPKWDEWVSRSRVMPVTEETLALQKELKSRLTKKKAVPAAAAAAAATGGAGAGGSTTTTTGGAGDTSKKRPRGSTTNDGPGSRAKGTGGSSSGGTSGSGATAGGGGTGAGGSTGSSSKRKRSSGADISIHITPKIKYVLVDDWENITKQKMLVNVPAKVSARDILEDYREFAKSDDDVSSPLAPQELKQEAPPPQSRGLRQRAAQQSGTPAETVDEIVTGLETYFNQALGLTLLYKFERLQYLKLLKGRHEGESVASIYGMEHLLRLFTILPGLIAQTTMDPVSIKALTAECDRVLQFIDDNMAKYSNGYINVSPDYENLAQ
ncbi:chromatin modification-related protein Eaf3p [[Candida] anglica]|uniref:Chromatin modification-related protein EAF3 n=1 Tax=[Candida] anglica TaxID=148631 RepID=A0ABP0EJ87_9ASCO